MTDCKPQLTSELRDNVCLRGLSITLKGKEELLLKRIKASTFIKQTFGSQLKNKKTLLWNDMNQVESMRFYKKKRYWRY